MLIMCDLYEWVTYVNPLRACTNPNADFKFEITLERLCVGPVRLSSSFNCHLECHGELKTGESTTQGVGGSESFCLHPSFNF